MKIALYEGRAKNVVFVFNGDMFPEFDDVYKTAFEPQRGIGMFRVDSHQEMIEIFDATSTAYQHFVTESAPQETLEFLNPVIL